MDQVVELVVVVAVCPRTSVAKECIDTPVPGGPSPATRHSAHLSVSESIIGSNLCKHGVFEALAQRPGRASLRFQLDFFIPFCLAKERTPSLRRPWPCPHLW